MAVNPKTVGFTPLGGTSRRYVDESGKEYSRRQAQKEAIRRQEEQKLLEPFNQDSIQERNRQHAAFMRAEQPQQIRNQKELSNAFRSANEIKRAEAIAAQMEENSGRAVSIEQAMNSGKFKRVGAFMDKFNGTARPKRTTSQWQQYEDYMEDLYGEDTADWEDT